MDLSVVDYLLVLIAVALGAFVQGSIGFGAGLVAVPVVALVAPQALPVVVIVWATPLNVAMALRERRSVDWSGVGWATIGRVPGSAVGACIVTAVSIGALSIIAGGAVLFAVMTSLRSVTATLSATTKTTAGFASGVMETTTSMGGPPLALLYQREPGPVLRSTLAVNFILGAIISMAVLAVAGVVERWQVALALALQPGLVLGLGLSRPVARYLDDDWLRPAVLAFATVAAVASILRGV